MAKLVDEIMSRTNELLQPNPGTFQLMTCPEALYYTRYTYDLLALFLCLIWGVIVQRHVVLRLSGYVHLPNSLLVHFYRYVC